MFINKPLSCLIVCILFFLSGPGLCRVEAYNIFMDKPFSHYVDNIPAWLESWGNTVTVVDKYNGEDLSPYDLVLDFDYDGVNALTAQERTAYTKFLNMGRGLYLAGERPLGTYYLRDISVLNYLTELGAGNIAVDWRDAFWNTMHPYETALPSPVTQNTTLTYHFDWSLIITDPGNGFFIAHTNELQDPHNGYATFYGDFSNMIGFERGQLLNAPNGRVVSLFDMTYMSPVGFDQNQYIFKEIVTYLGNTRSVSILASPPESVPEPSTLALTLGGAVAVIFYRGRQRQ